MHPGDVDCGASAPNAIHSIPQEYSTPAVFRSNESSLAAVGFSPYFDFVSLSVKPLWSSKAVAAYIEISAWEIDGKHPQNVYELFVGFGRDPDDVNSTFVAFEFSPREYFEGWGEKVNWVEMTAMALDEDYVETPWKFCMDNIVVDFRSES